MKTVLVGQINPLCDKLGLALLVEPRSDSAEAGSQAAGTCSRWKKDGRRFAAHPGKMAGASLHTLAIIDRLLSTLSG
jgi:hypothetical protein